MFTFNELERWTTEPLTAASFEMNSSSQKYKDVGDQILDINNADLSGEFADAEMRVRRGLADDAADLSSAYQKAQADFDQLAGAVSALVLQVKQVSSVIHAAGGVVTADGKVSDVDPEYQVNLDGIMPSGASLLNDATDDPRKKLQLFVNLCLEKGKELLHAAGTVYDEVADIKKKAQETDWSIVKRGVKKPDSEWNAEEANDWWTALSPAEQKKVIKEHPDWIGNLDGVPSLVRHKANVLRLEAERNRIDKRIHEIEQEHAQEGRDRKETRENSPWQRQGPYRERDGGTGPGNYRDTDVELEALRKRKNELDNLAKKFPAPKSSAELDAFIDKKSADYSLIAFDSPKDGHLRAAVGIGDVDNAKHLHVHTPGMNSSVDGSIVQHDGRWGGGIRDMNTVLNATKAELKFAGRNHEQVAGVYNLNYDAPSTGETINPVRSVLGSTQASDGADKLAGLCDGLQATHAGDPHMTVTGHSYGSTVAGYALGQTKAPDEFIGFGSPGFEARGNSDLNMVPGHTSIGAAEGDVVAWSGWHKNLLAHGEPHNNPLYEHFSTEKATDADGTNYAGSEGHSEYMNNAQGGQMRTSVKNIASIIAGNGIYFTER